MVRPSISPNCRIILDATATTPGLRSGRLGIMGVEMLRFDKDVIKRRLEGISPRSRTLFALTCAERLLPLYESYCARSKKGRHSYLRSALDKLWDHVSKGIAGADDEFLAEYPSLAPGDAVPRKDRTLLDPLAENAVLALGSAWECQRSLDTQKAFWAAEQSYEAMDYMAQHVEDIDYRVPGGEEALLESDFAQGELQRQLDCLSILERTSPADLDFSTTVGILREKAEVAGQALKSAAESLPM